MTVYKCGVTRISNQSMMISNIIWVYDNIIWE